MACSAPVLTRRLLLVAESCATSRASHFSRVDTLTWKRWNSPTYRLVGSAARSFCATGDGGGGNSSGKIIRVWEYRVSDEQQQATEASSSSALDVADGDADNMSSTATHKKKKNRSRMRPKATLYMPSDADSTGGGGGWTTIDTTLGSTTDCRTNSTDSGADDVLDKLSQSESPSNLIENMSNQLERHVIRHFMPAGYPQSVAPGYRDYVTYCFSANVCGSAAMVLSTQTLLLAVGVGSSEAAPLAAGLNWVLKDGIGQLGGILFASRLGSAATGSSIDSDPKRWRVASAISMDGATWLEILSPLFPGYFLPIASVANIGKNIGFLTASASRAAIHNALTLRTNLGDVTAKAGSQSIAASLVGTSLGICLSPLMQGEVANVAIGFAAMSVFHQLCTYKACRAVPLRCLNRHRMNLVMEEFVQTYVAARGVAGLDANHTVEFHDDEEVTGAALKESQSPVLSPAEVAQIEQFLPFISKDETKQWLRIGCKLEEVFPNQAEFDVIRRSCIGERERYVLNHDCNGGALIRLNYLENASGEDIMRGMLHAHILRSILRKDIVLPTNASTSQGFIKSSHGLMAESSDAFMEALEKGGWDTGIETIQVEAGSAVRFRIDSS